MKSILLRIKRMIVDSTYQKYILSKVMMSSWLVISEKKFRSNSVNIKYIQKTVKDKDLIVVFSGFGPKGKSAKYNYIKTLKKFNCSQLFVLDNIGPNNRGAYYLGSNDNYEFLKAVINLLEKKIMKVKPKRIIFVGSSKGGYVAMLLSTLFKVDYVISGAQQYLLGNYLFNDNHMEIYQYITGEKNGLFLNKLNDLLRNHIKEAKNKAHVLLHYSINEHTYGEHIKYLIDDLNENGFEIIHDIEKYYVHDEVSVFFPKFLVNSLRRIGVEEIF